MNMPNNNAPKPRAHPMMIIAGIAVILFCAAGIAAIMGWIPTSIGGNGNHNTLSQIEEPAANPVHKKKKHAEPSHAAATSSKSACSNCGVVESTRVITNRAQGSGVGAAGGAVVGGLLGNQIGGGHGKEAMTVLGAVGGAVAGNQIEGQVKATQSYEITVRLENGSTRTVQQAKQPGWRNGDHVRIVNGVLRSNG